MSELKDSTLISVCLLHTASASIKSSSDSLPSRPLAEISEDVSEPQSDKSPEGSDSEVGRKSLVPSSKPDDVQSRHEKVNGIISAMQKRSPSIEQSSLATPSERNFDKALPPTPIEADRESTKAPSRLNYDGYDSRPSLDSRVSSQSARPSTRDLYSAYEYKPKVKLGPRPSTDSVGIYEQQGAGDTESRPVSTLPAGLRMPSRKPVPASPESQQSQRAFPGWVSSREPLDSAPATPNQSFARKPPSVISNGLPTPTKTPEGKKAKMTPEKQRLMKALQLRQKQMAAKSQVKLESLSDEPEYPTPDIDNSILTAIVNASTPIDEPDIGPTSVKDLNEKPPHSSEDSPVSVPELSEGLYTQPSSVTDEEESATLKQNGGGTDGTPMKPENVPTKPVEGRQHSGNTYNKILPTQDENETQKEFQFTTPVSEGQADEKPALSEKAVSMPDREDFAAFGSTTNSKAHQDQSQEEHNGSSITTIMTDTTTTPAMGNVVVEMKNQDKHISQALASNRSDLSPKREIYTLDDTPMQHVGIEKPERIHAQQTSISKSISVPTDPVHADEAPLQAIGEHPEMNLGPDNSLAGISLTLLSSSKSVEDLQPESSHSTHQSQASEETMKRPSTVGTIEDRRTARQNRKRGVVSSHRVSSPDHSDEHFLWDDSFMEELKCATLEEAKPISVSKSPIKPVFSRTDGEQRPIDNSGGFRSVSSPLDRHVQDGQNQLSHPLQNPSPSRSFSAAHAHLSALQSPPASLPKKVGVSSGISQRIKALESLSSRPTSPVSSVPAPSFMNIRNVSIRSSSVAPDIPQGRAHQSHAGATHRSTSPSSSPGLVKPDPTKKGGKMRPESISVTATIVRDANDRSPKKQLDLSEPRALDLHKSPLLVDHQTMGHPPLSPLKPPRPRFSRYSSARSESSSSTEHRSERPPSVRRDSIASRLSISSRNGSEVDLPRSISDNSTSGLSSPDGFRNDKKESKRSRLMKRMSSISNMSRRSIAHALSPGPTEGSIIEQQEPVVEAPKPSAVDMGDVNIQFPDTLVSLLQYAVYTVLLTISLALEKT